MNAQVKRGLDILATTKYNEYNKIPKDLGVKLHNLIHSITPEMVGDQINPNYQPKSLLLQDANRDVNRLYFVPKKGRALMGTFNQTMRGISRVFPYLTDAGLEIAGDIFDVIDEIADTLAGEDDE